MDMKSLLDKMTQLSQVDEAKKKKPDADGDGVPDWADKKPGKDDHKEKVKEEKQPSGKDIKKEKDLEDAEETEAEMKKGRNPYKEKGYREDNLDEAISIQADGDEAMALLTILKLAGQQPMNQTDMTSSCGNTMQGSGIEMSVEADEDPTYSNTPDEMVSDMDAAVPSGNDMHREKDGWRAAAGADNPMIAQMEGKLSKMFESLSREQISEYGNTKAGQKKLTKVQKRATDRLVKAADKGDAKTAKKNQEVANNAWDRFDKK